MKAKFLLCSLLWLLTAQVSWGDVPILNVLDFPPALAAQSGLTRTPGNGSSDDTVAINIALQWGKTNGYTTVFIPVNGSIKYRLSPASGGLIIPNGMKLLGASRELCQVVANGGTWTNSVIRVAEAMDGNPSTTASIQIEGFTLMTVTPPTNAVLIDMTGTRNSSVRWVNVSGNNMNGQVAIRLSSTNTWTGGSESCFFNVIENCILSAQTILDLRIANVVDNGLHFIVNCVGGGGTIINFNNQSQAGLFLVNSYFSTTTGQAPFLPAGTRPPGIFSFNFGAEGYAPDAEWDIGGINVRNHPPQFSKLDGIVVTPGFGASIQGYTPVLPDSFDDQYVISGLKVVMSSPTLWLQEPGKAVNRHYVSAAAHHGYAVTNFSTNYVGYAVLNTNVPSSINSRLEFVLSTNASHMLLAEVHVNPSGVITNIVDRRKIGPSPKFNGSGLKDVLAERIQAGTMTVSSPGTPGMIRYDSSSLWVCTETNTWKRAHLCQ